MPVAKISANGKVFYKLTLSEFEKKLAGDIGCTRLLYSLDKGYDSAHGTPNNDRMWSWHINGAGAEIAGSNFFKVPYQGLVNHYKDIDIPPCVQIRCRSNPAPGKTYKPALYVRPEDSDDEYFVLLVGSVMNGFVPVGWILGKDAKKHPLKSFIQGVSKSHFVEQEFLETDFAEPRKLVSDYWKEKQAPEKDADFTIAIDTREQKPYEFDHPTVVTTLHTGDYSLVGFEHKVCVERKSKQDAYGTIGSGRVRFEKELRRMVWYDYAAIVIECPLKEFLVPPVYSALHPNAAINSLVAWSIRYGVHVFFCHNRRYASALTFRILEKYWRHQIRLKLEESSG